MPDERDPRTFFSVHHQAYVVNPGHARGQDLDRLVAGLAPKPGEQAVDVATGAGHTALRLAEQGAEVTIVDITKEMLEDALSLAKERHLTLTALEAPAEALPLSDKSFDLVTCRRAAHHFTDIAQFLTEAHRILRTGGRLGISDMTGSQTGIQWLNRVERLRDPSHRRALAPDEWYALLIEAGFHDIVIELSEESMSPLNWLAPVDPASSNGRHALAHINEKTASREFFRDGYFIKRRILIWALA
jgi:ubiquinone/menaquinone biosynthesis C-methylase UbiE